MEQTFDVLIAGAGYAGAVCARSLAEGGKRVLVLERRGHVGGNAYDCPDEAGVLIHQYGPHIFHTNDSRVFAWLSRFTQWRDYQHRVVADIPDEKGGRMRYPVPFNLTSLETAFGPEEGKRLGDKLIAAYGAEKKVTILELRQNPDSEISALADYVYEHVFVHYTMKQWGQKPEDIDPNTTARVPVFLSRDDRYFQDACQGMPLEGYTPMFQKMLDHPNIKVELGVDALERLDLSGDVLKVDGVPFEGEVIYTGQADELFRFQYGPLPYRTLDFRFETLEKDDFQGYGTVNYTVDQDYTRITEFKHLTGQVLPGKTTIVKEYSRAYGGILGEIPYYAIINPENNALYGQYKALADRFPNLHLLGRLAEYKYYNMDAIAGRALDLAETLLAK
ncbi:UDP-galactopyranose mutase [Pseudoflavonifractor sp. AF19-9AC]|uniref:UDP-galactopyranose mutase n=1 Tax=Pseudoflavonifractor sp. AF19-9AC TaxID=2292244 RepID=UPI000E4CCCBB|nr:UDP-galactopyranose mutase [Pseudoflavonifractor sp. AF19-9AC]RHR10743.1 UDP-galactopyranose mutase [Pseudoflavonifractor sp. AF19-9AC]